MKKLIFAFCALIIPIATIVGLYVARPHHLPLIWHISYTQEECGGKEFDPKTLEALNQVLKTTKTRYKIFSGHRSEKKNKEVNGVSKSKHIEGTAVDIWVPQSDRAEFYEAAKAAGFKGFGWGNRSVHIDLGPKRWWTYDDNSKPQKGKAKHAYLHKAPDNFKKDFKLKSK